MQLKNILTALRPGLAKIEILRHKLIAHRDNQLSYNQVYELAQLTHDAIKDVLDGALFVFNELAKTGGVQPFDAFPNVADELRWALKAVADSGEETGLTLATRPMILRASAQRNLALGGWRISWSKGFRLV